jgi:hypothetical protein
LAPEEANAIAQLGVVAQLSELGNWTDHGLLGLRATLPENGQVDALRVSLDLDSDAIEELADDGFVVGWGGGGSIPKGWNIVSQLTNGGLFEGREGVELMVEKALIALLEAAVVRGVIAPNSGLTDAPPSGFPVRLADNVSEPDRPQKRHVLGEIARVGATADDRVQVEQRLGVRLRGLRAVRPREPAG